MVVIVSINGQWRNDNVLIILMASMKIILLMTMVIMKYEMKWNGVKPVISVMAMALLMKILMTNDEMTIKWNIEMKAMKWHQY